MTKEELDKLRAMTKDELKERQAAVSERRQQLEEELRNFRPPYFTQREINAEKERMRRSIKACADYERKLSAQIFVRLWRRLKW